MAYIYVLMDSLAENVRIGKMDQDPAVWIKNKVEETTTGSTTSILVYREFFDGKGDLEEKVIQDLLIDSMVDSEGEVFQIEPFRAIEAIQEVKRLSLAGAVPGDLGEHRSNGFDLFDEACDYYYGRGNLQQDYSQARVLFEGASLSGVLPAFVYLGRMFEYGDGVDVDVREALRYYRAGAEKGSNCCYAKMACLYWRDTEVKDVEEGHRCWEAYFGALDHRVVTKDDFANFNFYVSLANENQVEIGHRWILSAYGEQMIRLLEIRKEIVHDQHSDNVPFRKYMLDVINGEIEFVKWLGFVRPEGCVDDLAICSDLLSIPNMGVILLVDVERGSFEVGDSVEVKAVGGLSVKCVIKKIDKYREFVSVASAGDSVGFLVDAREDALRFVKGGASVVKG